jgi:hypothetical protein
VTILGGVSKLIFEVLMDVEGRVVRTLALGGIVSETCSSAWAAFASCGLGPGRGVVGVVALECVILQATGRPA